MNLRHNARLICKAIPRLFAFIKDMKRTHIMAKTMKIPRIIAFIESQWITSYAVSWHYRA